MCGIYGQYNRRGTDSALIERMARRLDHRGPDGYGMYAHGPLAFGAGRLAIIDLDAGVQPIFNEDRSIAVIYNGEIYNFKTLRDELEALGHRFTTHTDTEVIVHGYEVWGPDVVTHLRGMFALGIWDEPEERLLLARDRLGEKPLYYTQFGDNFLFASEIKGLFEHPGLKRAVNPDALPFYLSLGYTPAPMTMFDGIEKLAPGERLIVDRRGVRKDRYWTPVMTTDAHIDYDEAVRQVRQTLVEAVEMRLMSDVPIGVSLSGGLDSTSVAAIIARRVQSFSVGFDFESGSHADDKFNVDARYAALAAERLNTCHHAITVRTGSHLPSLFSHLVYAMDEPVVQPTIIQTAYVAALARANGVPVLLSGDASDELFAGYPAYSADRLLERYLQIPGLLRSTVITPLLERMPARFDHLRKLGTKSRDTDSLRRYLTWMNINELGHLPSLMADQLRSERAYDALNTRLRPLLDAPHSRHFADRIAFTSLNLWIAEDSNMRVDKMSMAMSIESRAPFEDHKLVELALSLPLRYKLRGGDVKSVLKAAVADLVPPEIIERPKWGFFPPASEWLRGVLRPLVEKHLAPERVAAAGWFQPHAVSQLVNRHIDQHKYELWPVWSALVFHLWHAMYIEGSLTLDHKIRPADLVAETLVKSVAADSPTSNSCNSAHPVAAARHLTSSTVRQSSTN